MADWKRFGPAALFAFGWLLTLSAERQQAAVLAQPLNTMSNPLVGVTGEERVISDNEQQVAGFSDYVFRIFQVDSQSAFSVYVGYYDSQVTGKTIHSPRNCLPGAGWQTVESGRVALPMNGKPVTVNRYILANGPSQALVLYWYQGRGRVAHSEYAVKWDLLRDAATRGRTEEALVRVMVPIPPSREFSATDWRDRQQQADELARRVATELLPRVDKALPPWDKSA
jgi:EpsI family protein